MPQNTPRPSFSDIFRRIRPAGRVHGSFPCFLLMFFLVFIPVQETPCTAHSLPPCMRKIPSNAGLLAVDARGRILASRHATDKYVPASTLKVLTALAALHYLGPTYRFRTDFYLTPTRDLLIKGYGDPFLISEVLQDISKHIAGKLRSFRDLLLDETFFAPGISIPGQSLSTNPYDAPPGAFCANFNTLFFTRDKQGHILSAEPQTPMIPFAREKIDTLKEKSGRYTFSHDSGQAALYAGELLSFFLKNNGIVRTGGIRPGILKHGDTLIYTHFSPLTLDDVIKKMFKFSNNFVANQLFLSMGARVYGPPATLQKGVRSVLGYAEKDLGLNNLEIAEGSGISRQNRISPEDMLTVLHRFRPYRSLLPREGPFLYKTGTLKGISTRAGYIEHGADTAGYIVLFLKSDHPDTDGLVRCLERLF